MLRDARCKELGAVRTSLRPREGGTPHVYVAVRATAAPQGRNAAPPHTRASETTLSLGTDVNEGAPPSATPGRLGAKGRGPSDHAPCRCSIADWTWESSHLGFEAEGGNGAEPEHAPHPSAVADWPTESPRSILEGSRRSSQQSPAEDWLFQGWGALSPGNRGCDRGGPPGAAGYVGPRPRSRCAGSGREGEPSEPGCCWDPTPQIHLGPVVVRSATSEIQGLTLAGDAAV